MAGGRVSVEGEESLSLSLFTSRAQYWRRAGNPQARFLTVRPRARPARCANARLPLNELAANAIAAGLN